MGILFRRRWYSFYTGPAMCGLKLLFSGLQPLEVPTLVRPFFDITGGCRQEQNHFSWLSSYFHICDARIYVNAHTPHFEAFLQDYQEDCPLLLA